MFLWIAIFLFTGFMYLDAPKDSSSKETWGILFAAFLALTAGLMWVDILMGPASA